MTQVASETTAAKAQSTDKKIASIYDSSKLLDVEAIARERQASADLPVHWVADFDALEACLDDLETCDRVALDTEFIKRNTYFSVLALVQINTGKAI